ncbi:uncharacterized protein LOC114357438 [Ostrinia furnacalis]|uniref:uncharacterized protein LOC114357438 n=1 Tax=Ostrinia furnacalis TaxID=93504 RepID=UPI001038FBCB|nr:uncharacterized protein LOC114357438 [Ostrinia furnacalis]
MTDSSSYSSLMALVDSHLSKTSVQASGSEGNDSPFPRLQLPRLKGPNATLSETRLTLPSTQRLPLPTLSLTDSPIQEVLAMQVSNMLKAKEKKKQQEEEAARLAREREKLAEEMRKLKMEDDKNDEHIIDLVKAVKESMTFKKPDQPAPRKRKVSLSGNSSIETLFEPRFIDSEINPVKVKTPEPLLPCKTDMSYILTQKIRRGKCSAFGKVLTSRLKPVAAPYLRETIHSKVVRFDFSTKSPCDLIKEKLRQPRPYPSRTFDLLSIFPDLEEEFSK